MAKREYMRSRKGLWHHGQPSLRNAACDIGQPVAVVVGDKIPTPACRSCAAKDKKEKS